MGMIEAGSAVTTHSESGRLSLSKLPMLHNALADAFQI
jgi:hypothetical protein